MEKKTIFDLDRLTVEEYKKEAKVPVILVLDNVRSLNNIGSMFRTADGFAIAGIYLCGISATPPSVEIHKTALGAEDSVDWKYFPSTADAVAELKSNGWEIAVLEQVKGSIMLNEFRPAEDGKYAVVVGHEVDGVDPAIVNSADICLEIPQFGTKHSLNVAVSAAITLYQLSTSIRNRGK